MIATTYRRKEWLTVVRMELCPGKHGNARNSNADL